MKGSDTEGGIYLHTVKVTINAKHLEYGMKGSDTEEKGRKGKMTFIRAALMIIYGTIYTWCSYFKRAYHKIKYKDTKQRHDANFYMLQRMMRGIFKIMGIHVNAEGDTSFEGPGVIIGNHRSNFDALILITCMEKPIIFIGKSQIKKFIFVGKWFQDIGCLFIDRDDIRKSLEVSNESIDKVKEGYTVVVFPEGTRSKEKKVNEFKPGSLKVAMKAQAPIVPVTFINSDDCYEVHHKFRSANIQVFINDVVDLNAIEAKNTVDLANYLYEIIAGKYNEVVHEGQTPE